MSLASSATAPGSATSAALPSSQGYMRQGHQRPTSAEIARTDAGEQEVRRNYEYLQRLRSERQKAASSAPGGAPNAADLPHLPTYGLIRPDDRDKRETPQTAGEGVSKEQSPPVDEIPRGSRALHDAVSLPRHRVDLHLDEIQNAKVRAIFDPAHMHDDGSIDAILSWTDDELNQLLTEMRPEHMAVLMRKRIHSHQQMPAKRLTFHNLQYWEHGEQVIKDCSGFVEPGEMVGVSGGPDSGVTTLLGLLAGRLKPNTGGKAGAAASPTTAADKTGTDPHPAGRVLYDGERPHSDFAQQVGYAIKADIHLPYLTVEETLYFSARLRLHRSLPDSLVRFRVRAMLKLLGLSHVANTMVGDAMVRGVSGGEKRRVGFGVEMVAGHSVIVADLPTNGLDSATALSLLQGMAYACAGGFSLLFSIVQASQAILDTMDRLILMCKGSIIFTGPPRESEPYFRSLGFIKPESKALPQFLEEMSANPERFWVPYLNKHIGRPDQSPDSPIQLTVAPTHQTVRAASDESLYEGDYDPDLPLPPRRQAYISLKTAWHRSPAHLEMMSLLATEGTSLTRQVQQRARSKKQESKAVAAIKAEMHKENERRWQKSLLESTGTVPGPAPLTRGPTGENGVEMAPIVEPKADYDPAGDAEHSVSQVCFHVEEDEDEAPAGSPVPSGSPPLNWIDQDEVDAAKLNHQLHKMRRAASSLRLQPGDKAPADDLEAGSPVQDPALLNAFMQRQAAPSNALSGWWFRRFSSDPWMQFQVNFHRQWVATVRNTGLWRDIWLLSVVIGILIGLLFIELGDDEDGVRMRVGLMFFMISFQAFNAVQLVPVLAQQRPVYYQQLHAQWHCALAYYIPLVLIQVPIVVVECVLLLTPIYGIADLTGVEWGGRFWYSFFVLFFNSMIARTFMAALYAMSPNEAVADVFNQVTSIIFSKLCGYFIARNNIPVGWSWVYVISWFTYALRGLAKNDVLPITRDCTPTIYDSCTFLTGAEALEQIYDMDTTIDKWTDIQSLVYFLVTFNWAAAMLMAYVDWSELDRVEAPDFGTKEGQLAEASEAAEKTDQQVRLAQLASAESSDSMISLNAHTLQERPAPLSPNTLREIGRNASSLTLSDRNMWQRALRRVLRPYQSRDDRDENGVRPSRFSHIVVPIDEGAGGHSRREWPVTPRSGRSLRTLRATSDLDLLQVPNNELAAPAAPEASNGASSAVAPATPVRNSAQPSVSQPSDPDADLHSHSLVLADARHYQHEIKRLNIGALMHGDAEADAAKPAPEVKQGAVLEWYDLTYSVPVRTDSGEIVQRKLLNNVYGLCKPGLMVALMGSSGAGKSTLLDVLANKKTGGTLGGTLLLNGKPRDKNFAHVTGYVEQWDSHHPYSTVRESLEFSGRLRLAKNVSDEELARRVDNTLAILGIGHLQHQLIGGEGIPGVSQEVRKKVTIAVELITEPQLLFLDEPTTGLDAAGAYSVCHAIRTLANHIAVICTIHQPSEEIVKMFDGLLLMQPGGKVAYCGAVADLPDYFRAHQLGSCSPSVNIADFALESIRSVTSANATVHRDHDKVEAQKPPVADGGNHAVTAGDSDEKQSLVVPKSSPSPPPSDSAKADTSRYRDLPAEFLESPEGSELMKLLRTGDAHKQFVQAAGADQAAVHVAAGGDDDTPFVVPPQPQPLRSFVVQLRMLMSREFDAVMRNHEDLFVRYLLTIVMGFVVGTVFFRLSDSQSAADERVSALFVTLLFIMFTANAFLPQMFSSRPMYFREYTAGAYNAGPFYLARLIVQLPFVLTEQLILAIMLYFIANLSTENNGAPLGWMYFCFVITRYASITATYFIGALFQRANNANTIHATYFNLLFAFTGFLIRGPRIPIGWVWFYDINYLRWALDFLTANEVRHTDFVCNDDAYILAPPTYDLCTDPQSVTTYGQSPQLLPANVDVSTITSSTVLKCAYACGADLMDAYGVDGSNNDMARNLGVVAGFAAAFGIAGFLVQRFVNHIQR